MSRQKATHNARRVSPQVQHPEIVHKVEGGRLGIHYPEQNTKDPGIHQEDGPRDELLSECPRQLKPRGGKEKEEEPSWKDKPLHGMDNRQIKEVADIKKS